MVRFCGSVSCSNNDKDKSLRFFKVPDVAKNPELHKKFEEFAGCQLGKYSYICSIHFKESDFAGDLKSKLRTGAYPSEGGLAKDGPIPTHVVNCMLPKESAMLQIKVSENVILQINFLGDASLGSNSTLLSATKVSTTVMSNGLEQQSTATLKSSLLRQKQLKRLDKSVAVQQARASAIFWKKSYDRIQRKSRSMITKTYSRRKVAQAKKELHQLYKTRLATFMTDVQISRVMTGKNKHWNLHDISLGLKLRYGTNTYETLRKLHYSLPCSDTLVKTLRKVNFHPGVLQSVLDVIKQNFKHASEFERQAVMMFDEMGIDPSFDYFPAGDRVLGGKINVTVFIVRGLFSPWKQVFAFDFCEKLTKDRFLNYIARLESSGLVIRCVVCDLGGKNRGLWNALGIGAKKEGDQYVVKNYITSPTNNNKIYFKADVPHLIKLLRNHTLKPGISIDGVNTITKKDFQELLRYELPNEIKRNFKLAPEDLELGHRDKMKVGPALHVYSKETAAAWRIRFPERTVEADFIQLFRENFNLSTSRHCNAKDHDRMPYGMYLLEQLKILNDTTNVAIKMRVIGKNCVYPFQIGYMVSNKSTQMMFEDLNNSAMNVSYVLTGRTTQDAIENLFSRLRATGASRNPNAVEVIRRLKLHCMSSLSSVSRRCNTTNDEEEVPMLTDVLLEKLMKAKPHQKSSDLVIENEETSFASFAPDIRISENNVELDNSLEQNQITRADDLVDCVTEDEAFDYTLGFVARKLLNTHPNLAATKEEYDAIPTHWVKSLKNSCLTLPSKVWREYGSKLNSEFLKLNGTSTTVSMSEGSFAGFSKALEKKYPEVPPKAIILFLKTRLRIRLDYINDAVKNKLTELFDIEKERNERLKSLAANLPDIVDSGNIVSIAELTEFETNQNSSRTVYDCDTFPWCSQVTLIASIKFGIPQLTQTQFVAINALLNGVDVIAIMPTGSGKSAIFQVAACVSEGYCLVISPLVALIDEQCHTLNSKGVSAVALYDSNLAAGIVDGTPIIPLGTKFVYATPEKFSKSKALRNMLKCANTDSSQNLDLIVLDEVHCYCEWGKDFRRDYQYFKQIKREFPNVPILALSATLTPAMLQEIKIDLSLNHAAIFQDPLFRSNLQYKTYYVSENKDSFVLALANRMPLESGIIYCQTVRECEKLSSHLSQQGVSCATYHSDLHQDVKNARMKNWISGAIRIMIATSAFGMGINKSNCRFIIHYTLCRNFNEYVQQCGRAGRNGQPGFCYMIVTLEDAMNLSGKVYQSKNGLKELHAFLNFTMQRSTCKAVMLADVYGEEISFLEDCHCSNCDIEISTIEMDAWEVVDKMLRILSRAAENSLRVYPKALLNYLVGASRDKMFTEFKLNTSYSRLHLQQILLILVARGFIEESYEFGRFKTYVALKTGPKAKGLGKATECNFVISDL